MILAASLLPTALLLLASPDEAATLPPRWLGTYLGTFSVSGSAAIDPFRGELRIGPNDDDAPGLSWTLIYGEGEQRQVRPYAIVPVTDSPGRFLLDEKNGVTIDLMLVDKNLLIGQFEISENLITVRYEHLGDFIRCELVTFASADSREMTVEGTDLTIRSSPARSIQRAELKRSP